MTTRKKNELDRRSFFRRSAALTAGASAFSLWPFSPLAHAQNNHPDAPDRYYIFCYFPGGWDILLSLNFEIRACLPAEYANHADSAWPRIPRQY